MPKLTAIAPYFEVFDMIASLRFYRDILGFSVAFASPEVETAEGKFPHFVRLRRGPIDLLLNTAYDSNERPADRSDPRWAGCRYFQLYIDCNDVMSLHTEFTGRGLLAGLPAHTSYGYVGFGISDPDGHRLVFHQAL